MTLQASVALGLACLALCACAHAPPPPRTMVTVRLTQANADEILEPGDFLFRYVDPADPLDAQVTNAIIQAGEVTVDSTVADVALTEHAIAQLFSAQDDRFEDALDQGDPNAVHMAVYLGEGATAEAFGTTLDDARVTLWSLFADYRRHTAWRVMRHADPRVSRSVAEVARRWATGRMSYEAPFGVFVRDATWGEHARASALAFAQAFETPGGPTDVGSMFCSQFAVATLQSAEAHVLLMPSPEGITAASIDSLPAEAHLDAVASPLRVYGEWVHSGAFSVVAHVIVD